MASIMVNIEKGIEMAAEDVLHLLSGAQKDVQAAPVVIAALGTLLGAVNAAILAAQGAVAQDGFNIKLDDAVVSDLEAAWPDLKAFAATLGIKL